MEIKWDKNSEDNKYIWAQTMIDSGFSLPQNEIQSRLHVSRNWIHTVLQPNVNYIKIPPAKPGAKDTSICYYDEVGLREWIMQNAVFTVQSELYDVSCYINEINEYLEKRLYDKQKRISDEFLWSLGVHSSIHVVNERRRSQYPHVPVPAVDIFDDRYRLHFQNKYSAPELLYREAIMHGWIKCTIGSKKTIFIEDTQNVKENTINTMFIAIPKKK